MGRRKREGNPEDLVRLTFRLPEEIVTVFKTIAAIKRVKLEELGEEAIRDILQKHKKTLIDFKESI